MNRAVSTRSLLRAVGTTGARFRPMSERLPRSIGAAAATSLVVASMIGAGVFTTTGLLLRDLPSPLAVLSAWALGGLLSLCCALSYAELTAALPDNGGEYQLLSRIYHPGVGFVAGWISFVVGFSAPIAAVAVAFGRYASWAVPGIRPDVGALGAILLLSVLHAARVSLGSTVHTAVTIAEVLLIAAFVAAALWTGSPGRLLDGGSAAFSRSVSSPSFAVGLVYVSFAYSGWNAAAYVAGEVTRPERNLQRALVLGTSTVALLYLAINTAFLMAAPRNELAGVVEVGYVAAVRLFGQGAGRALSAVIALCLLASIGALLMTGARVYESIGRDHAALRLLAWRGGKSGPVAGVALQAAVASVMAITASFDALLTYVGFTLSISALVTVAGLFVLRRREPALARPYRTGGYPVTPLIAMLALGWMGLETIIERPATSVAGLATLATGALLYFVVRRTS